MCKAGQRVLLTITGPGPSFVIFPFLRIEVNDADAHSFRNFLRYVYSGRLPANFKKTAEIYLPMAEKYDLPALKEECVSALGKRVCRNGIQSDRAL